MPIRTSTAGALVCLFLLATIASADARGEACVPLGGVQSDDVASARSAGSSELTEFWPDGSYRVSRCGGTGDLRRSATVAPIVAPGGSVVMVPVVTFESPLAGRGGRLQSFTYGDPLDSSWAKEWLRDQAVVRARVLPPTQARPVLRPPSLLPGGDSCSNAQYRWTGLRLFPGKAGGSYTYRARTSSMPHGDADRRQVTKGHHTWDGTANDCGFPDVTSVASTYGGTTTVKPHTHLDGINVVDFGNLANVGCAGALACTLAQTTDGVFFSDIDQRYGDGFSWTTSGAAGAYDVWNVAAHESGHAVGMGHAGSSLWLTMFPQACLGCTRWRTLGLGDAMGLRCRYGVTQGGC